MYEGECAWINDLINGLISCGFSERSIRKAVVKYIRISKFSGVDKIS